MPNEYFCHILHRLKNPPLFSVRDVRHRRQPMFKKETKRLSYKIFDEQLFREVMEEQRMVFCLKMTMVTCIIFGEGVTLGCLMKKETVLSGSR